MQFVARIDEVKLREGRNFISPLFAERNLHDFQTPEFNANGRLDMEERKLSKETVYNTYITYCILKVSRLIQIPEF